MMPRRNALRYALGFVLTVLVFCYAGRGDFSWLTLTGPISLEPSFSAMEGPGYVASPALQAIIVRLLFLVLWYFFCMVPDLAGGLERHRRHLSGALAAVYLLFSYLSGDFSFFLESGSGATTVRIASLVFFGLLLCGLYDADKKSFGSPALLSKPRFIIPFVCLFIATAIVNSLIFQEFGWLSDGRPSFVMLRMAVLATALSGALAFHSWQKTS